ncbi:MAG: hypothetical protein D6688_12275 [Alphaproteobacteria bacterium]|nr:MAG: hypothetical protein D6688_12275 [Alphaproteobacteria bacterium]
MLEDVYEMVRPVETEHPLVRIGGAEDGGYLVPDDLEGVVACYSPGVADKADFELEMAARGIPSFMADRSVEGPPVAHPMFHFEKKFLGSRVDDGTVTLDDWVGRTAPATGDLVLQMDIEGAEYDVLSTVSPEVLKRFRIIVVEFHRLYGLVRRKEHPRIRATFERLSKDFAVVHIHPNNAVPVHRFGRHEIPPLLEMTFLRRDRISEMRPATRFPHPLDRPNVADMPDFPLPPIWYRRG